MNATTKLSSQDLQAAWEMLVGVPAKEDKPPILPLTTDEVAKACDVSGSTLRTALRAWCTAKGLLAEYNRLGRGSQIRGVQKRKERLAAEGPGWRTARRLLKKHSKEQRKGAEKRRECKRPARLSPKVLDRAAEKYITGEPYRDVAAFLDVSYGRARHIVLRHVTRRGGELLLRYKTAAENRMVDALNRRTSKQAVPIEHPKIQAERDDRLAFAYNYCRAVDALRAKGFSEAQAHAGAKAALTNDAGPMPVVKGAQP